jgi:hypothetical protein
MRRVNLGLFLIVFFLTACNAPGTSQATATPNLVATQVAILQTNMPTETLTPPPATATPEPSPTIAQVGETPTLAPPTASPTVESALKDSLGQPTWSDTLDSGKGFYLFENEGTRVTAENGALLLSGLQANDWLGWSLTFSRRPKNFYMEATFITGACSGRDRYGMVFRAPGDSAGYFYGVTCSGVFELNAANFADGSNRELFSGSNAAILTGANQTNRLGVLTNNEKISLYANDILLQEITDSTFNDNGYFGAFVAANQTAGFTVKLDEIKLWELP